MILKTYLDKIWNSPGVYSAIRKARWYGAGLMFDGEHAPLPTSKQIVIGTTTKTGITCDDNQ